MQFVARWLLLLVLAFDLAGSPFHAHAHDLGLDHTGAAVGGLTADGLDNLKSPEPPASAGHSLLAVRAVPHPDGEMAADAAILPGGWPQLLELQLEPGHQWEAHPLRAPRPLPRRSWPDGRAPPPLLA